MKYLKLFENFVSGWFNPEVIQDFNEELYNRIQSEIDDGTYTHLPHLLEDWSEKFYNLIKSVEPFKNITIEKKDELFLGTSYRFIIVDSNDNTHPFKITFSILETSGKEKEGIGIRFESEARDYPEIENLEDGKPADAEDGVYIEYKFTIDECGYDECRYIDKWNDDAIPRLFRNIEKSIFPKTN
jgi:hypothetical protein